MGERKVKNGMCSANEKRNLCRIEKIVITKSRMRVKERKEHRINVEKSYNRIQLAKLNARENNHHKPPNTAQHRQLERGLYYQYVRESKVNST